MRKTDREFWYDLVLLHSYLVSKPLDSKEIEQITEGFKKKWDLK